MRSLRPVRLLLGFLLLIGCGHPGGSGAEGGASASTAPRPGFTTSLGLPFVYIPGGSFRTNGGERGGAGEITLSPFYAARYPVTVGMFRQFVAETGIGKDHPALIPMTTEQLTVPQQFWYSTIPQRFTMRESNVFAQASFSQAERLVEWFMKRAGDRSYKLISEAEWPNGQRKPL